MRADFPRIVTEAETDDLLTTGEAARLLGTSRQHVMDLCNAGDLPYRIVGKHRRVSRRDVEALRSASTRLTRDQLRSLWLSHAIAGRIVEEPETVLRLARRNLHTMLASAARSSARVWLEQWKEMLNGPIDTLLEALTSRSPRSRELRQNHPFAGVLEDSRRRTILENFSSTVGRKQ